MAEKGEASRQPEGRPRLEPQQAVDMTETSSWEEQGADPQGDLGMGEGTEDGLYVLRPLLIALLANRFQRIRGILRQSGRAGKKGNLVLQCKGRIPGRSFRAGFCSIWGSLQSWHGDKYLFIM